MGETVLTRVSSRQGIADFTMDEGVQESIEGVEWSKRRE